MQQRSVHKPIRLNRDKSPKYLGQDEARYILNSERNPTGANDSLGITVPFNANELLCTTDAQGNCYPIGTFRSELTNEVYVFHYNDEDNHFISRINEDGSCEIVCASPCLGFSPDPKRAIENWRVYMKYDRFCAHRDGKLLIWTDGVNIGAVDVEAAIATDGFTTDFFERCSEDDECAMYQLCVPEPCGALTGEFVPLPQDEIDLNNRMVDVGIQVRYRHVYYDQRASEWSDISTLYYQDARSCFDTSEGFPRCMKFRIPVGNPLVEKIEFAFRTNQGAEWYRSETIEKYKPYTSEGQKWYERELSDDLEDFDGYDCTFEYTFCNDKGCEPIDPGETSRTFNPMPREPQGFFPIKNSLAFYNYKKGNCPLIGDETKKIELSLNCDEGDVTNCNDDFATVTVYALIHETWDDRNEPIWRWNGAAGEPDDKTDRAYFGGLMRIDHGASSQANSNGFEQYFTGDARNFIVYIEGTDYWEPMKQWRTAVGFDPGWSMEVGVLAGMNPSGPSDGYIGYDNYINSGFFYYQKAVLKVPKGTKGFLRLVSHKQTTGSDTAQDTSTFVYGIHPDIRTYQPLGNIEPPVTNDRKHEIAFDTCSGDVELFESFVIVDFNVRNYSGGHNTATSYGGYVTDKDDLPIEGAEIWEGGSLKAITDHNGFYAFYLYGGENSTLTIDVRVEMTPSGGFVGVKSVPATSGGYGRYTHTNIKITETDAAGYADNYLDVGVVVKDCDNQPVGGIRVAISGSKYKLSESDGIARFKLRNYTNRARVIRGIVMDVSGCFNRNCEGICNPCRPDTTNSATPPSYVDRPYLNLTLDQPLNIVGVYANKNGLKAGGRYPWGVVVQGDCGRISGVYPVTVLEGSRPTEMFMNVPKTQAKGEVSFCDIDWDANGVLLPSWGKCAKLVRGENMNPYKLQWIVDKVERLGEGKIKLTIQSLNDYNAENAFKTNTSYDYEPGDRVEFITNGDGSIFDIEEYGLLNYAVLSPYYDKVTGGDVDAPANVFNQLLIQGDVALKDLTAGGIIEIQHPKECTVENTGFFEIGVSIPLIPVSGGTTFAQQYGTFHTFDTFIVTRQVPGKVAFDFEHRNPSDFWGNELLGLSDTGKVHFINRFENEKRYGRNFTINSENQYNTFGDFEKTMDGAEHGDIISASVYDGKIGLAISQFDNTMFQVSDEFLRVGGDGIVRAAPADALISDGEPKLAGRYGCDYDHIGSILYGDGYVVWCDTRKGAYVKHNFSSAVNIAEGSMVTYFIPKFQGMRLANADADEDIEKFRFITGINQHTNAVMLTMKRLTDGKYSNEKDALIAPNETLVIDPRSGEFLSFASFTPDRYSNINLADLSGAMFLSFFMDEAYNHPVITNTYNKFYGVAVDRVITVASNVEPDIMKRFVALEIQDRMLWYVSKVLVDDPSYESLIPPRRFDNDKNKWNAGFLSNINSKGGIYALNGMSVKPSGYYTLVTFVRDNTDALKWQTFDNNKRIQYDRLDMILIKYFYEAQSGMKENL